MNQYVPTQGWEINPRTTRGRADTAPVQTAMADA